MKKCFLIFLFLLLFVPSKVLSLSSNELLSRNVCNGKIELAQANTDGGLTNISCHDS